MYGYVLLMHDSVNIISGFFSSFLFGVEWGVRWDWLARLVRRKNGGPKNAELEK